MTINALGVQSVQTAAPPPPPPPPPLTPVQQGDVSAGRARIVDGQVYAVGDPAAPPTAGWGDQPAGTPYRQSYDAVAARLGTADRTAITAEIDRQLYGTPATSTPATSDFAGVSGTATARVEHGEGIGSFFEGAIKGDLGDNSSWSALAGQTVVGFIPVVGQIADIRDTGAAIGQVIRGEEGGWSALGAAAIGWVPGIGDAAKGGLRAADNVVDAGVDAGRRSADEAAGAGNRITRSVDPATGRVQIEGPAGRTGDWSPELNARNLEPNADYRVNGYHYGTDASGRVSSVQGRLDLQTADRNGYQQGVAGREDRLPTDQGGHLIASTFNGPGDRLNLVAMDGQINRSGGAWNAMEGTLRTALQEGRSVDIRMDVQYPLDSQRPSAFRVEYTIDGETTRRIFRNQPGG